jgi:hypothetical protein
MLTCQRKKVVGCVGKPLQRQTYNILLPPFLIDSKSHIKQNYMSPIKHFKNPLGKGWKAHPATFLI